MFTHSQGYIFNARQGNNGKIGVLENYKYFNGSVDIIFGVTQTGHVCQALFCDRHTGFKPLKDIIDSDEDMELFLKSRRGTYAVIGSSTMFGVAKVNRSTGDIKNLQLYTPIGDSICDGKPVIICDRVSNVKGFHHSVINDNIYDILINTVVSDLSKLDFSSKGSFLKGRL